MKNSIVTPVSEDAVFTYFKGAYNLLDMFKTNEDTVVDFAIAWAEKTGDADISELQEKQGDKLLFIIDDMANKKFMTDLISFYFYENYEALETEYKATIKPVAGPNRQIIINAVQSAKFPSDVEFNPADFIIKEKSVIVPLKIRYFKTCMYKEFQIEFKVWGAFSEVNNEILPYSLKRVCSEIKAVIEVEQTKKKLADKQAKENQLGVSLEDLIDQAYSEALMWGAVA